MGNKESVLGGKKERIKKEGFSKPIAFGEN